MTFLRYDIQNKVAGRAKIFIMGIVSQYYSSIRGHVSGFNKRTAGLFN
jgi:hypothetical protein